jgi:hypothetical protein
MGLQPILVRAGVFRLLKANYYSPAGGTLPAGNNLKK